MFFVLIWFGFFFSLKMCNWVFLQKFGITYDYFCFCFKFQSEANCSAMFGKLMTIASEFVYSFHIYIINIKTDNLHDGTINLILSKRK